MARTFPIAFVLAASALAATPAVAQLPFPNIFDSIFRQEPPRPPSGVPGGAPERLPPGPPPSERLPPGPPPIERGPRGGVQQQALPPPPGVANAPPGQVPQQTNLPPGAAPGQRPRVPGAPPPPEETLVEPPAQKITNPTAVFAGLDKITGRITTFDVAINETVRFGALEVTPRACYTRPPTENANTDGFIEVDELTLQGELRRIFTGWMFAASPGLNAVEHPIYDVWLTDCKGGAPPQVVEAAPETAPAAPARQPRAQPQPQQQRRAPPQALPPPPVR